MANSNYPHFEQRKDGGFDAFVEAGRNPKRNAWLLREAVQMLGAWGGVVHLAPGFYDGRGMYVPPRVVLRG